MSRGNKCGTTTKVELVHKQITPVPAKSLYEEAIARGEFIGTFAEYQEFMRRDGELFLVKDTVAQLRGLTAGEILHLKAGVYKGIRLLGYYKKGDTPAPIEYYLSDTSQGDDGGSVIAVGGIKLEHNFAGTADAAYFGLRADGVTDNTAYVQQALISVDNVILPKGDIVITNTIYVRAENTLTGQGSSNNANFGNTKIIFNPSSYIDLFATDGSRDADLGYLFNIKF